MRLGIKAKQVGGVTAIVGAVVVVLSGLHLGRLAQVGLAESESRAELLRDAIFHRAREVVGAGADPYRALAADPGLRSILESSVYSRNVTFAAIADVNGVAVVHSDPALEGQPLASGADLPMLLARSQWSQLRAVYAGQGRNLELRQPLRLEAGGGSGGGASGGRAIGSIRIGVSTLLLRQDLDRSLRPAVVTAGAAFAVAIGVAMLLAQRVLRPIHVIRRGLTRLGQGELGVRIDLAEDDEFGDLGTSFNAVSAQLSEDRSQAGQEANPESIARHARKLAALGRLSAGVAHEVKNPLNAMMIHLELLRQQVDAEDALSHVDVIAREIRRLDDVVQGFLKFARPEELALQPVSLADLLRDVTPIIEAEAGRTGVVLSVDPGDAPDVIGDRAMLRQAVLNLALNACQAMPAGGSLRIRCAGASGRRVSIAVTDTGVGISPEHLRRIFDLYFTTKERGSGIGLSMVYRTVHMHDGEIEVASAPGGGTTFTMLLPQA